MVLGHSLKKPLDHPMCHLTRFYEDVENVDLPTHATMVSDACIDFGFGLQWNGMTKIKRRSECHVKRWRQFAMEIFIDHRWRFSNRICG
jgi:hypothetical protein